MTGPAAQRTVASVARGQLGKHLFYCDDGNHRYVIGSLDGVSDPALAFHVTTSP